MIDRETAPGAPERRPMSGFSAVAWFAGLTTVSTILILLLPIEPLIGPLLVVFIPTLVAGILIRMRDGRGAAGAALFSRQAWRIDWKWAAIALAAAIGLRLLVSVAWLLVSPGYRFQPGALSVLLILTFVFAAGEEIGWRGFALPEMIRRGVRPWIAALLLGIPWALLHIPLTLSGKLSEGSPAAAQVLIILSMSFLTTWLYLAGKGSLWAPVLFHGGQNAAVILNDGLPAGVSSWLMVMMYGAFALLVILLTRGRLGQTN